MAGPTDIGREWDWVTGDDEFDQFKPRFGGGYGISPFDIDKLMGDWLQYDTASNQYGSMDAIDSLKRHYQDYLDWLSQHYAA